MVSKSLASFSQQFPWKFSLLQQIVIAFNFGRSRASGSPPRHALYLHSWTESAAGLMLQARQTSSLPRGKRGADPTSSGEGPGRSKFIFILSSLSEQFAAHKTNWELRRSLGEMLYAFHQVREESKDWSREAAGGGPHLALVSRCFPCGPVASSVQNTVPQFVLEKRSP